MKVANKVLLTYIFLIFGTFFFASCKKTSYSALPQTSHQTILNEEGNKDYCYYVIIYSNTCDYCNKLENEVVEYYNIVKNKNNVFPYIYVACIDRVENLSMKLDSDDDYESFLFTDNYKDIYFSAFPALVEVTSQKITKLISSKTTTRPYTEIKNLLKQTLGE